MREETRECFDCEESKPLTKEFFYKNGRGGFRKRCKKCIVKKRKEREELEGFKKKPEYEINGYNGIDELYC